MTQHIALTLLLFASLAHGAEPTYWPQWRGPLGTGVSPDANPPIEWSEIHNVAWKVPVPGKGHSTPVVWGDRIFLTTAIPIGEPLAEPIPDNRPGSHDNLKVTHRYQFAALAFRRSDGKLLWQTELNETVPHEAGHITASLASASPVVDAEHLIVSFGSHGIFGLDHDGHQLWRREFGRMHSKHGHGEGSSPALHGDTVIVNWDHEDDSFVVALDKSTGKELWQQPRDEPTSWASPITVEHEGHHQVIISGTGRIRGYDLATGEVLWSCGGLSANVVASPVAGNGMVFAASSYDTQAILAIRLNGAAGDITDSKQVVWRKVQRTPYIPSPLLYGDSIYYLRHYQGILSRVEARTGAERLGPFRLNGLRNIYASPMGAAGRVYIVDLTGAAMVFDHSDEPQMLSFNQLNDNFAASPVPVESDLYLRGERYLYCLRASATK